MIERMRVLATSLGTTVRVVMAQLRGVGSEGQDSSAEPYDGAEVVTPLGFVSRPKIPASGNLVTALVFRDGDDAFVIHVRDKLLPKISDSDVAAGDAVMFSPGTPGTTIKLLASGAIAITSGSQDVTFNGGTLAVARHSDQVQVTIQVADVASQGLIANLGTGQVTATTPVTVTGTITGAGAAHVKA